MTPSAQSEISTPGSSIATSGLDALLYGAAVSRPVNSGWIRITGADRVRWLNGMVTNSIQEMKPGQGTYNFLLSVQGRIQGDAVVIALPDALMLQTGPAQIQGMMALLDRYIIMDDVELTDMSETWTGLQIAGPKVASLLEWAGISTVETGPIEMRTAVWNDAEVRVIHAYGPLVPRFELWAEAATTEKFFNALITAGAAVCEAQSLEWLRVLEGTPLYGTDIRDRELPQETGQTRALHFAKGCYLGQEIVERIRSRGNVHRTFGGFLLEGELPPPGTTLESEGKQIGELTSVAAVPSLSPGGLTMQIGLGYVRREVLDRSLPLSYIGGVAKPVSLPFLIATASQPQITSGSSERV